MLSAGRGQGRGRGRGRGRPLATVDDLPVVGVEASMVDESPNKPTESASAGPQRQGRGKLLLRDALRTVGREPKLSESLKLDVLTSTLTPSDEPIADGGGRRIVEASADNIVVSINNTDTAAVTPAASVTQKPPKIGSGRLGKTESASVGKPRGNRGKGQSTRTATTEEPVTIGIAVIRTPSDQPEVQYKAVDQSPKPKGILKQTQHKRNHDWVEEPVEMLDWDKELEEAQRRKVDNESKSNLGDTVMKDPYTGATKLSAVSSDNVVVTADDDDDDDDEWEDVEDDETSNEDVNDISAESFDQFIRENTLKLDIALATPDVTEWTMKDTSGSITAGSQDSFLKTPVGQTRVVDWGAEMDQLSQSDKFRISVDQGQYYAFVLVTVVYKEDPKSGLFLRIDNFVSVNV